MTTKFSNASTSSLVSSLNMLCVRSSATIAALVDLRLSHFACNEHPMDAAITLPALMTVVARGSEEKPFLRDITGDVINTSSCGGL